jgi:hypothetical protein
VKRGCFNRLLLLNYRIACNSAGTSLFDRSSIFARFFIKFAQSIQFLMTANFIQRLKNMKAKRIRRKIIFSLLNNPACKTERVTMDAIYAEAYINGGINGVEETEAYFEKKYPNHFQMKI